MTDEKDTAAKPAPKTQTKSTAPLSGQALLDSLKLREGETAVIALSGNVEIHR